MIPGIYLILLIIENYYYDNPLFVMVQPINKFDKELNYHLILFTENKKKKILSRSFCLLLHSKSRLVSFITRNSKTTKKKKFQQRKKKNCFVGQSIIIPFFFFFF